VGLAPTGSALKSFRFVFSSRRILLSRAYLAQSPFSAPASADTGRLSSTCARARRPPPGSRPA
jgi:hypothetical protein